MTAAAVGYAQVRTWGAVMLGTTQTTVVRTTAWIVLCRLSAQRLTAAARARALPAEQAGSGRARLTRVRRWRSRAADRLKTFCTSIAITA